MTEFDISHFSDAELQYYLDIIKEEIRSRKDKVIENKIKEFRKLFSELNEMGISVLYDNYEEFFVLYDVHQFQFKDKEKCY